MKTFEEYFHEPMFDDASRLSELVQDVASDAPTTKRSKAPPRGVPSYLAHLWSVPLLTRQQEYHYFRQMNFYKYQLDRRRREKRRGKDRQIEMAEAKLRATRNRLIESNLRLVVSLVKKYADCSSDHFDELVCVGNETLVRAVDRFDYRRGLRFSTYAHQAIRHALFSVHRKDSKRYRVFVLDGNETTQATAGSFTPAELELEMRDDRDQVKRVMSKLAERDRRIIMARFGINRSGKGLAFHAIAKEVGLSTTRTIQLFNSGISKIRTSLARHPLAQT